jgi:hypothetical protein
MTQRYHVVSLPDSLSALAPNRLAQVLAQDGQLLLPMLDLIVAYHGSQAGRVALEERQLRVTKPRLRKKTPKAR